ncbi:MAG: hypothetical protein ACLQMO_11425 [Acidobacteriaceae bacterium]
MSLKGIRNLGSLLGLLVTVAVIWYLNSPCALVAGIAFLMAADILCLLSVIQAVKLKARKGVTLKSRSSFVQEGRAYVLLLVAWQIAIVGVLSISSEIASVSVLHLLIDYISAALYFICSYRVLSVADSAKQDGGYKPFNFFGYPRSRKLIFTIFACYCSILPLTIMSLEDTLASTGWRPIALQSSQACLLMVAIMSVMSGGLLLQRYHGVLAKNKSSNKKVYIITLLLLACTAAIHKSMSYGIYSYVLSAIAIASCAVTLLCLWGIDESTELMPAQVHVDRF